MMNKLKCKIFGHKWLFNFSTMPNKCICSCCRIKAKFNLYTLEWENIDKFYDENRTDEVLIEKWVINK